MLTHYMHHLLAQSMDKERVDKALRSAKYHPAPRRSATQVRALVMRLSEPQDARALSVLAQLDEAMPLNEPALVGETDGRLIAAIGLDSRRIVADPFSAGGDVRALLQLRARQLMRDCSRRPRLAALRAWL